LTNKSFLNRTQMSITANLSSGVYFLAGYPSEWADCKPAAREFTLSRFQYIAWPYREHATIREFNPTLHIGLNLGYAGVGPTSLRGISGCAIWKISASDTIGEDWSPDQVKVVGVQTGVYTERKLPAIKGTKWQHVVRALNNLIPEFRPALNLWLPGEE
jgi:hypothetical protein